MKFIITTFVALYVAMMPIDSFAGNGKATITSDQPASNIYANGKLVAMTGDDKSSVNISLPEGDYIIKVQKNTLQWTYAKLRRVYIGNNVKIDIKFELGKYPSKIRFERLETMARGAVDLRKAEEVAKTDNRYIDHGDGTVTDKATGLMWMKCAYGLSGSDCSIGKEFSVMSVNSEHCYEENSRRKIDTSECYKPLATAKHVVNEVNKDKYSGYNDWRMPAIDELHSLVLCPKARDKIGRHFNIDEMFKISDMQMRGLKLDPTLISKPEGFIFSIDTNGVIFRNNGSCHDDPKGIAINRTIFPNTPGKIWSASEMAMVENEYYTLYFSTGMDSYEGIDFRYGGVKLVRVARLSVSDQSGHFFSYLNTLLNKAKELFL